MNRHPSFPDDKLETPNQRVVASWVANLPEDTVSLSWRSALNEQILAKDAARRKRARLLFFARPGLGLAVAASLVAVFIVRMPTSAPHSAVVAPSVEANLVAMHSQAIGLDEIAAGGMTPGERATDAGTSAGPTSEWTPDDLGAL